MNIPTIKLVIDREKDAKMILARLSNPEKLSYNEKTFAVHPKLKMMLDSDADKSPNRQFSIIAAYIAEYGEQHRGKIDLIMKAVKYILSTKSERALTELAKAMDYNWIESDKCFYAIPTILPYAPFEKDTFYFSLPAYINGKIEPDHILFTAIHEISHFILFRILYSKNMYPEYPIIYFLQEGLAPIVMNRPEMIPMLGEHITKYQGNPDIALINFQLANQKISLVDFFRQEYEQGKLNGLTFIDIIAKLIDVLNSVKPKLCKRKDWWNKHGQNIKTDSELYRMYTEQIIIDASD